MKDDCFLTGQLQADIRACLPPNNPVDLGFFDEDEKIVTKNACILVVSYDFKEDAGLTRPGNDSDLRSLKKTFQEYRKCKYFELLSPTKKELLDNLEDEQKLRKQFDLQENDPDNVLFVFILSHGESNGVILTDHKDEGGEKLETFTTTEILTRLKRVKIFKDNLKMVVFGPCRGKILDLIYSKENSADIDNVNSSRVQVEPNENNFVLVFSTVETTMSTRDTLSGTWLIQRMCYILDSSNRDLPLGEFLTRVQHQIHSYSLHQKGTAGQTVEVKIFPHRNFTFKRMDYPSGLMMESDVSFPWRSEQGILLSRRMAAIYCDEKTIHVEKVRTHLEQLEFETRTLTQGQLQDLSNFGNLEAYRDIGCFLVCIFSTITSQQVEGCDFKEVCVTLAAKPVPLTSIVSQVIGPKCDMFIGRPKIFIVIDTSLASDARQERKSFEMKGTNHSGVFILILPGKDSVDVLLQALKKLKSGHNLLAALSELLNAKWYCQMPENALLPQIQSTLHFSLSFPPQIFVFPVLNVSFDGKVVTKIPYSSLHASLTIGTTPLQTEADSFLPEPTHADFAAGDKKAAVEGGQAQDVAIRTWLVSSAPGMGKSVLTKHISLSLKKKYSNYLILEINLLDHRDFFADNREVTILQFLQQVEKSANCSKVLEENKVAVLLDGFDEICPLQRNKVLKLIQAIAKERIPLWITTRPQEEREIKNALIGINFATLQIQPLKEDKQLELMELVSKMSDQQCSNFLDTMTQSGAAGLMENPLHLTMIAEHVSKTSGKISGNIFELYYDIIRKKILPSLENQTIEHEENAKLLLVSAAMEYFQDSPDYSTFEKSEINVINRTGIVTVQNDKSSAKFIHQTFAEIIVSYDVLGIIKDEIAGALDASLLLTNERFAQTRFFIESFLKERGLTYKLNSFFKDVTFSVYLACLEVFCKEGLANLYEVLYNTCQTIEPTTALQENFIQFLLWSSKSSQELSVKLLELAEAKEIGKLFLADHIHVLNDILQNTVDRNYVQLFSLLNKSCPEAGRILSFVRKHSDKDQFFLQRAAAKKFDGLLELLLDAGADPDSIDSDGCTALFYAINEASLKCVQKLIEKNESIDIKDKLLALHYAGAKCDLEALNCHLVGKNAHAERAIGSFLQKDRTDVMNYLIRMFQQHQDAFTEKHFYAELLKCHEIFQSLQTNPNGLEDESNLQEIWRCHIVIGTYLFGIDMIESSANQTLPTIQIETLNRRLDVLDATINVMTNDSASGNKQSETLVLKCMRETAVHMNKKYLIDLGLGMFSEQINDPNFNFVPFLQFLGDEQLKLKTPMGHSAVHFALIKGDFPLLQALVVKGLDLQGIDKLGWSVIHFATLFCSAEILEYLLGLVGSEQINRRDTFFHYTPIFYADLRESVQMVEMLVKHGADPRAKDYLGGIPFHDCARKNGRLPVMRFYLENGHARLNEKRILDGYTALHLAAKWGTSEILQFLCDQGAELRETNKYGETALDVARKFNNPECVGILKSKMDL